MEVVNKKVQSQNSELIELSEVKIKCPVCGKEKKLNFPNSVINQAKNLTTISIPKGLVCKHHFQAFIDKNFSVRGYQKVDFEYANDLIKGKKLTHKDNDFYEYIIIEENYCAYKPKDNKIVIQRKYDKNYQKEKLENETNEVEAENDSLNNINNIYTTQKLKHNLKEIYDEFWDFIDDNNKQFKDFIVKDTRRLNLTSN